MMAPDLLGADLEVGRTWPALAWDARAHTKTYIDIQRAGIGRRRILPCKKLPWKNFLKFHNLQFLIKYTIFLA